VLRAVLGLRDVDLAPAALSSRSASLRAASAAVRSGDGGAMIRTGAASGGAASRAMMRWRWRS